MNLTVTGLFMVACVAIAVWLIRKKHHRKTEVLLVSLFWILAVATPWGGTGVAKIQALLGNTVQVATSTVNNVSSK
ncbi:hypothetical protein [Streptomyces xanthochromogenes]|uniref:hypothetical protein n=1 Tax=Streptomyces xanthochromogenes TaxID=67384 RepID=UPI002F4189CB